MAQGIFSTCMVQMYIGVQQYNLRKAGNEAISKLKLLLLLLLLGHA
jgi:hypothetical protein